MKKTKRRLVADENCKRQTVGCRLPAGRSASARSGISLLEVLVSIFILSMGLLGVAALIPLGKLALVKTNISDRTGACGRAAMRDVKVRRMLDYSTWYVNGGTVNDTAIPGAIALDPLGYLGTLSWTIGNTTLPFPRYTFSNMLTIDNADPIFRSGDELLFVMPKDMNPPEEGDRPVPVLNAGGVQQNEGNFSWFLTVCPSPGDIAQIKPVYLRRDYTVSVVVCYKREFDAAAEHATVNTQGVQFLGGGYGGGTIRMRDATDAAILNYIKTDQWVMLWDDTNGSVAKWYRVVGVGNADAPYVSLVGPDWDASSLNAQLVVVEGVTGVYTTTVHLDDDCTWTK